MFTQAGIKVVWMTYAEYPEYPQLWGAFEPRVSVIDLLLNTGSQAGELVVRSRQALDLLTGR